MKKWGLKSKTWHQARIDCGRASTMKRLDTMVERRERVFEIGTAMTKILDLTGAPDDPNKEEV
jgi:hypothetical protein